MYQTRATLFLAASIDEVADSGDSPSLDTRLMRGNLHAALQMSSVSGTADAKLEFSQSQDGTNWDSYADNPDITSSTLIDRPNNAEGMNFYPMPHPLGRYVKFKITGIAANPADALATLYALWQEGNA